MTLASPKDDPKTQLKQVPHICMHPQQHAKVVASNENNNIKSAATSGNVISPSRHCNA